MDTVSLITPNKILIVGNGFDLACTLPTKYNNFIEFMKFLKPHIMNDIDNVGLNINFSKFIDKLYPSDFHIKQENFNYNDLSVALNKFHLSNIQKLLEFESDENFKKITQYQTIYDNEWLDYFVNLEKNNDYLWLDFENEVLVLLNEINKLLKELNNKPIPNTDARNTDDVIYNFFNINIISKEYKLLKNVIHSINGSVVLKNKCEYTRIEVDNKIHINTNAILEYLYTSLFFFTTILKNYFTEVVNELLMNIKIEKINQNLLLNFSKCYSFNYTNSPNLFKIQDIIFLHGSCKESKRIILGVNLNSFNKEFFLDNSTLFSKQYQTLSYTNKKFNINNYENTINTFYIWGLSLGNADKFFLDKIINLLGINDRLKLVIFHHNESAKASYIHKLINYYSYDKISELIDLDYLSFEKSPPIFKNKNEISQ